MDEWERATAFPKLMLRLLRNRPGKVPDSKMELGIEVCIELCIALYQLGRELMGLPVNVPLGAGCWALGMLVAIRILWIMPITSSAPRLIKLFVSVLILFIAVNVSYSTVEEALRKQRAGEQLSPDTRVLLSAIGGVQKGIEALKPLESAPTSSLPASPLRHRLIPPGGSLGTLSNDLLLKIVPSVTGYLQDFREGGWYGADDEIYQRSWQDQEYEIWNHPFLKPSKTQDEWKEEAKRTDDAYRAQLMQLLSEADALRVALLSKLPSEAVTPEDNAEAAVFAEALTEGSQVASGRTCCPPSIKKASDYLDALAKRVSRIPSFKN